VIAAPHVEMLREFVAKRLGLRFDDTKLTLLAEVIRRRASEIGSDAGTYVRRLDQDEIGALARELTVGETYFFRNREQFHALAEVVLPERIQIRSGRRILRLLSAGCASGEEPYTMAMVVRQLNLDPSWDVSIRGVDLNPAVLERARRARYTAWSLRETPTEVESAWFRADARELVLDDKIRAMVRFEEKNLASDDPDLWQPEAFDVIFCRNVLMYFTPEAMRAAVARISRALAPGGYLFLGHAETLRGISHEFHLCHTHETFYYQLRDGGERRDAAPASPPLEGRGRDLEVVVAGADSWVEVIQQAADRIRALTTPAAKPPVQPSWDLGTAVDLFRRERFAEALGVIDGLPEDSTHNPDVLLLRAVVLSHGGQLAAAETACARLLAIDELNAGAHYVLALCRESAGDLDGAVDHDQIAAYLDPAFAMPRLHLGLIASRTGERDTARRELAQAIALLDCEDASRLLLFGGGFQRAALIALCRAELGKAER